MSLIHSIERFDRKRENTYYIVMEGNSTIIKFFFLLIPLIAIVVGGIVMYEKSRGKRITEKFREFSTKYKITDQDLRSVPRVFIPDNINVSVKLSEKEYSRLKGKVVDLSLSGLRVSFRFPFKQIPEDQIFRNVSIVTPISKIRIKEVKIVRIENSVKRVIFALYVKDIVENEYTELKKNMIYFEKFSKNGNK